jgi:hypothetical protein
MNATLSLQADGDLLRIIKIAKTANVTFILKALRKIELKYGYTIDLAQGLFVDSRSLTVLDKCNMTFSKPEIQVSEQSESNLLLFSVNRRVIVQLDCRSDRYGETCKLVADNLVMAFNNTSSMCGSDIIKYEVSAECDCAFIDEINHTGAKVGFSVNTIFRYEVPL